MVTESSESSEQEATGEFTIELSKGDPLLDGTARMDGTKVWTGQVAGSSKLVMLSAGDPRAGAAGYVGLETFEGTIDGRAGTICFLQRGIASGGGQDLDYRVVPGTGTDELEGLTGTVELTIDDTGHHVRLRYQRDA